jgi:hypothetical protein
MTAEISEATPSLSWGVALSGIVPAAGTEPWLHPANALNARHALKTIVLNLNLFMYLMLQTKLVNLYQDTINTE